MTAVAVSISPPPLLQFTDNNGVLLAGGKLFTYAGGTTTKLATYVDSTGTTTNTNPIILNAEGQANVWLPPGVSYKFVLAPANDTDPPTNPFWTVDNIVVASLNVVTVAPVIGGTSGTTITSAFNYIPINNTTGAAFIVNLPANPAQNEQHTFIDIGLNAALHQITIGGNGNTIDGLANFVMLADGQAITMTFIAGAWALS